MGRFRFQLLLSDNTSSSRYSMPKNDQYSDLATQWTLVSVNLNIKKCGSQLIYDQIDTHHADMCFSIISKTLSVY